MVSIYLYAKINQLHNKSAVKYSFLHFCCAIELALHDILGNEEDSDSLKNNLYNHRQPYG
jgi:hypothetical protein